MGLIVQTVIEIPQGSQNKYEYNQATGLTRLDRVLYAAMHYPVNYGFIPETWTEDDDPLDVLVFGSTAIHPLVEVDVRVIGALLMKDEHGPDAKVVGVVDRDPRYNHISAVDDLGTHRLREVRHFFAKYKNLQGLTTVVGNYQNVNTAVDLITAARQRYRQTHADTGNSRV